MENHVTYLFGAGASALAVPIQNKLTSALSALQINIRQLPIGPQDTFGISHLPSKLSIRENLLNDFNWLNQIIGEYGTPDTYAEILSKALHQRDFDELKRLKIAYSTFLVLAQNTTKTDQRYYSFINRIVDSSYKIKNNIKILSWNYDYQMERAFSRFSTDTIIALQKKIGVYLPVHYPLPSSSIRLNPCIFKINGTATLHRSDILPKSYELVNDFRSNQLENNIIEQVIRDYALISSDKEFIPQLSFAWESETLQKAIKATENTTILVVIGYSFPDTNRIADKQLISNMKNLKEIHVQDKDSSETISSKLEEFYVNDVKIYRRAEVNNFFIPKEIYDLN